MITFTSQAVPVRHDGRPDHAVSSHRWRSRRGLRRRMALAPLASVALCLAACVPMAGRPAETVTVTASPLPEQTHAGSTAEPTPPTDSAPSATVDRLTPAAFRAEVEHQLDDAAEDIDDLESVHGRGGTFGLVTNVTELSFNLGQLQAIEPPTELEADYDAAVAAFSSAIDAASTAVSGDDDAGITSAIAQLRDSTGQVRAVAERTS